MPEHFVIVGGDAAGMSAASRLARTAAGARVTVFEREDVISYAACGMPYHLDGRIPDPRTLLIRTPADFAAAGVDVRTGQEVVEVDPAAAKITVRVAGAHRVEMYDKLLLATGAHAAAGSFPVDRVPNVFTFRRYTDLMALISYLRHSRPTNVTVVGGGYIGIELAEVLTRRGLAVTLVEAAQSLMPGSLDTDVANSVAQELRAHGVILQLGQPVTQVDIVRNRARRVLTASDAWACDAVVIGVGVRPATELAVAAGVGVDGNGAIITDEALRTNVDQLWAAGDCVTTINLVTGQRTWAPLGPAANKQGRIAADNMLGRSTRFAGVVGTALVKAFELEIGRTGLTERAAAEAGFDAAVTQITAGDRAPYYPGGNPTVVRLVADRATGRLLGGQVVGRSGVAGRVNVIATALQGRMDIEQFAGLDLGYAPPFAPVWDPLLVAVNQLVHCT